MSNCVLLTDTNTVPWVGPISTFFEQLVRASTSHISIKPSSACGCVMWFSQGNQTYGLVRLDISELILEGK